MGTVLPSLSPPPRSPVLGLGTKAEEWAAWTQLRELISRVEKQGNAAGERGATLQGQTSASLRENGQTTPAKEKDFYRLPLTPRPLPSFDGSNREAGRGMLSQNRLLKKNRHSVYGILSLIVLCDNQSHFLKSIRYISNV